MEVSMLTQSLAAAAAVLALGTGAYSTQAAAQCDPVPGMVIGGGIGAAIGNAPGAAVGAIIGSAISGSGPCYYGRPYAEGYYAPPPRYAPPPAAYYEAPAPAPYYEAPPVAYYPPAPVYYGPAYYGPAVVYRSYPRAYGYRYGGHRHYAQVRHHHRHW
jgi:hypothetical protein